MAEEQELTDLVEHPVETLRGDRPLGRSVLRGSLIGFVLTAGACGALTYAFGGGLAGSTAVALFTGLWGGLGLGGMMGFVLHQSADH